MKSLVLFLMFWGTMNAIETPEYLYKVLAYRNWQATEGRKVVVLSGEDDRFIHFSTEDQVDRTIEKYWAGVPQFVILKIDAARLQGELKYENNPDGSSKYYHLYDGFLPIQSIVEAKIVCREPLAPSHKNKLNIVQIGDPILRKQARPLTKAEILSDEIQDLIEDMKMEMRRAPGVGLAAPQIGQSIQLVVIEDMEHSHLTLEQLKERERTKVAFHVLINPTLIIEEEETASFFEGCLRSCTKTGARRYYPRKKNRKSVQKNPKIASPPVLVQLLSVPIFLGVVPRARAVRVECLNECGEPALIRATGWYARILQHEIDHLNGTLFIDKASLQTIMTGENYEKFWKDKSIQEVCDRG